MTSDAATPPFRCPLVACAAFGAIDSSGARADEAYVCDASRVVYVRVGTLEDMKRTDPCIAAYYGLTIQKAPATTTTAEPIAAPSEDVLPKPAVGPGSPVELVLRPAKRGAAKVQNASLDVPAVTATTRRSASSKPILEPGADFRRVRVLNASSPTGGWYLHQR